VVPSVALKADHDANEEHSDTGRAHNHSPSSPLNGTHRGALPAHVSPTGVGCVRRDEANRAPRILALDVPAVSKKPGPDLLTQSTDCSALIAILVFAVFAKHTTMHLSTQRIVSVTLSLELLFEELGPKGNLLVVECQERIIR
jgi:hypothetical protein